MRRISRHKLEIELWWQQKGPDEWVALITDRKSGRQVEVRSETELREALESLRDGGTPSEGPVPADAEGAG